MIKSDPTMYVGEWVADPKDNFFTKAFDGKHKGKIRVFLFKESQFSFVDNFITSKIDALQQNLPSTLNPLSGRAIFYNGDYRDSEININFMIDPLKDPLQRYELLLSQDEEV